jgi:integrase
MTHPDSDKKSSLVRWKWPVDPTVYDRSPALTDAERASLGSLIKCFDAHHPFWPEHARENLDRLLRPINDVLDYLAIHNVHRRRLITNTLLREMHDRRQSFWGWTREEWIEFLRADTGSLRGKYYRPCLLRPPLMACGYLLTGFTAVSAVGKYRRQYFIECIFGGAPVQAAVDRVVTELQRLGFGKGGRIERVPAAVYEALLLNRSPRLEDLNYEALNTLHQQIFATLKPGVVYLSRALANLGVIAQPLFASKPKLTRRFGAEGALDGVSPEWLQSCHRWHDTSTLASSTRQGVFYRLAHAGRWLSQVHPEVTSPAQWTRELAAEYVAAVLSLKIGAWSTPGRALENHGKPVTVRVKQSRLAAARCFFEDCQEWQWIPRRFDPGRSFATPRSVRALIAPDPRVIADDIWAKLLWAGLNLTADDLPARRSYSEAPQQYVCYPLEMVRALVIVWLFAGLRSDEIYRLRVGCIRWRRDELITANCQQESPKDAVCLLDVPVNKTQASFTKPVDRLVGEAILAWEQARPAQLAALDPKTGELAHFLFFYRGQRVGNTYLNQSVIPMLCRKAGIPSADARGDITSHRARSTIASQLFNAKEPLTLLELQAWLGHRSPESTQHYAKIMPAKLTQSYVQAGYFERNRRLIDVLVDQEAVKSGAAAQGESWKYYDLGHRYCSYDFFDQCPHRMACAKCSFYVPKGSSRAQLLEAKTNLQRLKQEIPLTEAECAAIEDGLEAVERLCARLADIPTPAGPTPHELGAVARHSLPIISRLSGDENDRLKPEQRHRI